MIFLLENPPKTLEYLIYMLIQYNCVYLQNGLFFFIYQIKIFTDIPGNASKYEILIIFHLYND